MAHLGELGEDQGPITDRDNLLQHLRQSGQLSAPVGQIQHIYFSPIGLVQILDRVVAYLLELHQHTQHQAAPLDAFTLGHSAQRVLHHRFVQCGLLFGQAAVDLGLYLVGQVLDDTWVGLHPAQDKGANHRLQPLRRLFVAIAFDGQPEVLAECLARLQVTGVEEMHDRPQLRQAVFHRRAGQGQAKIGRKLAHRLRLLGRWVLDVLGLIQDHAQPGDGLHRLGIAAGDGVAGQHHVHLPRRLEKLLAAQPFRALVHQRGQQRPEATHLSLPVGDDRSGANQ